MTGRRTQCRLRRGSIIHEATIAVLLATAVIAGAAQVMVLVSKQQRELDGRSVARREAGNLMEEAMSRSWDELTTDGDTALMLSEIANERLTDPRASLAVAVADGDPDTKRVTVEVTWGPAANRPVRVVRLVAWRYSPREDQP